MSQAIIRSTLITALAAWATTNSITLVREGQGLTEKPEAIFIQAWLSPSDTTNPSTNGLRKRYRGDLIVHVWCPDGQGAGAGEVVAEQIAALFPLVPKTYLPVSIEQTPSIKTAITEDEGWRIIPICIPYRMEV